MRTVTRDEFFNAIQGKDVHPTPTGSWPYLSVFKYRDGRIFGQIQAAKTGETTKYFLAN